MGTGGTRRRSGRAIGLIGVLSALLSLAVVSPATSAPVTVIHADASGLFFNQCSGELLDVTTRITFVVRSSTGPTGTLHTMSQLTQTGSAVGQASGTRYQFVSVQSNNELDFSLDDATRTFTSMLAVVGQGSAPNLRAQTVFHFTIRDGEIVASIDRVSFTCS